MSAVRIFLQMFLSESVKQMQERDVREVMLPQVPSYRDDKGVIWSLLFSLFCLAHFTFSVLVGLKLSR